MSSGDRDIFAIAAGAIGGVLLLGFLSRQIAQATEQPTTSPTPTFTTTTTPTPTFTTTTTPTPTTTTTPPPQVLISFANISAGQTLANSGLVIVTASIPSAVANIQFFVDNTFVAQKNSAPYEFSLITNNFSNGTHSLNALANLVGGGTTTASVSVTFANTTPTTTTTPSPTTTITPSPSPTTTTTPEPTQPPGATIDLNGIPKLYGDSQLSFAPKVWYLGKGNYAARISQWGAGAGQGIVTLANGVSYFDTDQGGGNVRWNVWAGQDQSYSIPTLDRSAMTKANDPDGINRGGYMAAGGPAENWRDCEITMAIYLYPEGGDDSIGWYCRGGKHGTPACEGFKYEPNVFYTGLAPNCNKETAHGGGGTNAKKGPVSGVGSGNIVGQWVFWKTVWRNIPTGRKYPDDPTVPLYIVNTILMIKKTGLTDPNTLPPVSMAQTNWQVVGEWNDPYPTGNENPNWGNNPCGGVAAAIGSWGGPEVTFRADLNSANVGYGHIRVAYVSVREINPQNKVNSL